jgi:predicted cupin superfamily sugar epimerase
LQLGEHGAGRIGVLGTDFDRGMKPQVFVPRGTWQGARLLPGGNFTLLGATVFPGFDFADFELASRDSLLATHPQYASLIHALTR